MSYVMLCDHWQDQKVDVNSLTKLTMSIERLGESSKSAKIPESIPIYLIDGVATIWDAQSEFYDLDWQQISHREESALVL